MDGLFVIIIILLNVGGILGYIGSLIEIFKK